MTTTLSLLVTNPHVAALERAFGQTSSPVEWLVISHNDFRLERSLSSALAGRSAAVLQVPQETWDFQSRDLIEAVEWALQQAACRAALTAPTTATGAVSGYRKLLAEMQHETSRIRAVRNRFAMQVQQLSQIPVVHSRWRDGELAVYGLFYRSESGLFLQYDVERDTFHPLVS
jgi:hypothetical protein